MYKRILALTCLAMSISISNLAPIENRVFITCAEEREEPEKETGTAEEAGTEMVTETVWEAAPEKETGTAEEAGPEEGTETAGEESEAKTDSPEETEPKKIQLQGKIKESTAGTPLVTKVSDGTTALTAENIAAIENAFSLDGIVGDDEVFLKVREDTGHASWDSLSYEENKLGGNTVSLNSLKESFELEGTDCADYELDADALTANDLKVTAEITPKTPEISDYDMTKTGEDQALALADEEVSGILLSAGIKGTDEAFWYHKSGLPLTVGEGCRLLTDQYVQYTDSSITESGKTYYVKVTKEDHTVWYYGPYTIEMQCDGDEPVYQMDDIKKINFGNKSTEFTIIIKDTDGSGTDADSIRYFIGNSRTMKEDGTLPAKTDSSWEKPAKVSQEGDSHKITVTVPASGYLYIQAADMLANNSFGGPFHLLVLENKGPTVTVTCQDQDYDFDTPGNTHTLNITAEDAEDDGTEPYSYSGIQSLTYSLCRQNDDGTTGDTVLTEKDAEASMPLMMDAVKAARVKTKDQIVLQNDDQGQLLNGNYILTVTAVDFCGNETVKSDWILNFDNEAPKIVDASCYGYTHMDTDGNAYYGQKATTHQMQITILEKNFDPNLGHNSGIVVRKGGRQVTEGYMVTWEHEGELHKATVDLTGINGTEENDIYTVGSHCQDMAGNQLDFSGPSMVIDKVSPEAIFRVTPDPAVTNQRKQDDGRYYFNGDYQVTVVVEDANFDAGKVFFEKGRKAAGDYDASAAVISDYKKLTGDTYNNGSNIYTDRESMEGVFRYTVHGTDKAGNALVMKKGNGMNEDMEGNTSCHIVIDKTKPTGTLAAGNGKKIYYQIQVQDGAVGLAEPYRTEKEAYIQITSDDFSPVQIAYTTERLENDEVKEAAETKGNGFSYGQNKGSTVRGEQIFRISGISITDCAGNAIFLAKTNKIYLDATPPTMDELAPAISVVASAGSDEHGTKGTPLFKDDVRLNIKVTDPYGGSKSSGLGEVSYSLYRNGSEVTGDRQVLNPEPDAKWNGNYEDPALIFCVDRTITVNASGHNDNDIRVVVDAKDRAGNTSTRNYTFGIDVTAPVIEVEYDNHDAQNGRYFKADRVATVTVTERNFSPDLIDISTQSSNISSWSYRKGMDANGDDDKWTAEITYNVDGEYTLDISGEDLLGQSAGSISYHGTAPQDFVIDKTAPVLVLGFDRNDPANGRYYNSTRTATFSVDDVNFGGQADIAVNVSGGGAAPAFAFTGKSSSAVFDVDGIYSLTGTVTDLAGNRSLPADCEEFVIDQTAPVITFHDVENMAAYGRSDRAFAPYITIDDTNFDPAGVTVTMSRVKWDSEEEMTDFGGLNGSTWQLEELEQLPENDAVYTLNVGVQDMAGNLGSGADSVTFSLNRYGSVYVLGEKTSVLLGQYYTNEAQELTLTEYNLSNQADSWIDVSRNREGGKRLQAGKDYQVQVLGESGNDCNWKQTTYQIHASNFPEDGTYQVLVYSKDTLENATTNENPASEEYASVIIFCKDTQGPTVTLTGVENDGFYNETSMPLLVNYFDNTEMERLDIRTVNAADENDVIDRVEYLADDGAIEAASGKMEYTLKEHAKVQNVIVTATDRAGNSSEPQSITFTMSTSAWVRFYNNKQKFYGTIAGTAGALGMSCLMIASWRRRKKNYTIK